MVYFISLLPLKLTTNLTAITGATATVVVSSSVLVKILSPFPFFLLENNILCIPCFSVSSITCTHCQPRATFFFFFDLEGQGKCQNNMKAGALFWLLLFLSQVALLTPSSLAKVERDCHLKCHLQQPLQRLIFSVLTQRVALSLLPAAAAVFLKVSPAFGEAENGEL